MRKHLGKALKSRSKTIKSAIEDYNRLATKMKPPRPSISWDEVVEYTFLAEFDILRDTREDIRQRVWATPSNRVLMTQFYKLIRAEEELDRLHNEIRRLVTFMKTERQELLEKERELMGTDVTLALQVRAYRLERGRFDMIHRKRLLSITKLSGFDWANAKYFRAGTPHGLNRTRPSNEWADDEEIDAPEPGEEEDDDNEEEEETMGAVDAVLSIALDAEEPIDM